MSLAYFPLFPDDYEADTAHLSMAEDGAYNRLLRLCWRTAGCSVPADLTWIYRRMRAVSEADRDVVQTVLAEFFKLENGRYSNARLTKEWLAANAAHERRKNAGAKGGKAKGLKTNDIEASNAVALGKQPEPEPYVREEPNASSLPRKRAKRLPEDWALPDDLRDWAVSEGGLTSEAVAFEAAKFRDYWCGKAGKDAAKLDWSATWRNWCRTAAGRQRPNQPPATVTQFPRIVAKFHEGFK
jgi:uncharacterized protein YdaU (DUF1376 family)